jgi:hypothetical protein
MTTSGSEHAINETASKAKQLLFDRSGKPKGNQHYIPMITMHRLCKPLHHFASEAGDYRFQWRGAWYAYNPKAAKVVIESARSGDYFSDGMLRCAAALMLDATRGIVDPHLRSYASERLSGDVPPPREDRRNKHAYRDAVIAGWLIHPLVLKGMSPTRNEATKDRDKGESACSIVSKALIRVGLSLSERRLAEIWAEAVTKAPALTKN